MPTTADRRLYLTEGGEVVEHGDPKAAYLLAVPGDPIPDDVVQGHPCGDCDFVSKSAAGLGAHRRTHKD